MKTKSKHPKVRLNLEVSEEVKSRLDDLQVRSGAESMTEVIRRSVAVYDMLLRVMEENGETVLRFPNGKEKVLLIEAAPRG